MSSSPTNQPPAFAPTVWQWVLLCVGLVGAMGFAVAHAPPGWQRPGPTALWFSVAGGMVVGGIAVANRINSRWVVFLVGFFAVAVSIAGMTGERYRVYVAALEDLYLGAPARQNANNMAATITRGQGMHDVFDEMRAARRAIYEAKRPFPVFLAFRLEALGITAEPWPLVFWLGEIFLGGLIGAFTAIQWHKWQSESTPGSPSG